MTDLESFRFDAAFCLFIESTEALSLQIDMRRQTH